MMNPTRAAAKLMRISLKITNERGRIRTKLAPTLVCEHGRHHPTTDVRGGKLGRDNSRQRVVTADADAHDEPPYDEDTNSADRVSLTRNRLTERCDDDEHEFNAVYSQN